MSVNPVASQPVSPANIYLHDVSNSFTSGMVTLQEQLDKLLAQVSADPTNPVLLAQYQAAVSTTTLYRNLQSNTIKVIKDTDMNTVRNLI